MSFSNHGRIRTKMVSRIQFWLFLYLVNCNSIQSVSINTKLQYCLNYNEFWDLGANWSGTSKHSDYSMPYPLVDYTEYANSIEDFIAKYPTVTIETRGQAISTDTFGDVGKGKFGSLLFETINFNHAEFYRKNIVFSHRNAFWWSVYVEIGVGFKTKDKRLYVQFFINGWIYSGGHVWRELHFGLAASKITFNPRSEDSSEKHRDTVIVF